MLLVKNEINSFIRLFFVYRIKIQSEMDFENGMYVFNFYYLYMKVIHLVWKNHLKVQYKAWILLRSTFLVQQGHFFERDNACIIHFKQKICPHVVLVGFVTNSKHIGHSNRTISSNDNVCVATSFFSLIFRCDDVDARKFSFWSSSSDITIVSIFLIFSGTTLRKYLSKEICCKYTKITHKT